MKNAADAPCLTLAVLSPAHFKRQHAGGVAGGMVGGCRAAVGQPAVSAPPGRVLEKLITIAGPQGFMDATLWQHLGASLTRILVALLAAVIIGVPVGIAMGLSPTVRGILDPLIELYRPVPPLAYLPLMVIWFGIGETSKILLIYRRFCAGRDVGLGWRKECAAGAHTCGAVARRQPRAGPAVRHFTGALPEILTGLRIGLGVGWSTLVAAELIAATRGLGLWCSRRESSGD